MKKENKNKIQPRQQVVIQILWSILQNEKLTDMGRRWGRGVFQRHAAYAATAQQAQKLM